MEFSIVILISVISLYIFALAVEAWKNVLPMNILSDLFGRSVAEDEGTEVPEEDYVKPRYDVDGYRRRMAKLKESMDDDGLYEVPVKPVQTDFTGTEVITSDFEVDLEEYLGR